MVMMRVLLAVLVLTGVAVAPVRAADPAKPAPGEASLGVLLETLRSNRTALVKVNLDLTPEESAQFWPLYDRYQQEISAIGDRMLAIIEDYKANFRTLSNEKALQLINDYLAAEADRLQVRRTYLPEFAKILPGRTVARFYQIENKIDAVLRYELAATIPVVDQASEPPAK
jgi:hypothetical protein